MQIFWGMFILCCPRSVAGTNGGFLKWGYPQIIIGFSITNHPFWGISFQETSKIWVCLPCSYKWLLSQPNSQPKCDRWESICWHWLRLCLNIEHVLLVESGMGQFWNLGSELQFSINDPLFLVPNFEPYPKDNMAIYGLIINVWHP